MMKLHKRLLILAATAIIFTAATVAMHAQKVTDAPVAVALDGKWLFNEKKSNTNNGIRKGSVWNILTSGNEIKISKTNIVMKTTLSFELVLVTDNRGETNKILTAELENMQVYSKTRWEKQKLVRKYKTNSIPPRFELEVTETYRLSKDGKQLIVETRFRSDLPTPDVGGVLPVTYVFDKES